MAMSCRYAARTCAHHLRSPSPAKTVRAAAATRRFNSTEAAAAPPTSPKIAEIVNQISRLTLLETADLITSLKIKLNIPDLPVGGFAAPAPGAAAAPVEEADEPPPAPAEKKLFNIKLQAFDATSKAKIIKEVKSMLGLSLVESKKFVESAPKMMKENISKEDAQKIIDTLKAVGATVTME